MIQLRKSSLLYVAGSGHSGSTLLDILLGNHTSISGVGEVHLVSINPEIRLCACGVPIIQCDYWDSIHKVYKNKPSNDQNNNWERYPVTKVNSRIRRFFPSLLEFFLLFGSTRLIKTAASLSPNTHEHLKMAENSWSLYDAIATVDDTQVVVDSSKNAVRMKLLYMTKKNQFKVVHLVRDGRAVAASAYRRDGIPLDQGTKRWKRAVLNVMLMMKSIPSQNKRRLRYEDLCDNPERELIDLCQFLDLPFENQMLDFSIRIVHNIPGNPMLFKRTDKIVKDERWKSESSQCDLDIFDKIAGRLNHNLGYS